MPEQLSNISPEQRGMLRDISKNDKERARDIDAIGSIHEAIMGTRATDPKETLDLLKVKIAELKTELFKEGSHENKETTSTEEIRQKLIEIRLHEERLENIEKGDIEKTDSAADLTEFSKLEKTDVFRDIVQEITMLVHDAYFQNNPDKSRQAKEALTAMGVDITSMDSVTPNNRPLPIDKINYFAYQIYKKRRKELHNGTN
ncbi:MAG: hypothetical protein WCP14_04705 [bacterium]